MKNTANPYRMDCSHCGSVVQLPEPQKAPNVTVNVEHALITGTETTADLLHVRKVVAATVRQRSDELTRRRRLCEPPDFDAPIAATDLKLREYDAGRKEHSSGLGILVSTVFMTLLWAGGAWIALSLANAILYGMLSAWFGVEVGTKKIQTVINIVIWSVAAIVAFIMTKIRMSVRRRESGGEDLIRAQTRAAEGEAASARARWPDSLRVKRQEEAEAEQSFRLALGELEKIEAALEARHIDPHEVSVEFREGKSKQTAHTVVLRRAGRDKVQMTKALRAATGLGLEEAFALVNRAPAEVKTGLSRADADRLKGELDKAGGYAEVC